jgi:hypothetical protein
VAVLVGGGYPLYLLILAYDVVCKFPHWYFFTNFFKLFNLIRICLIVNYSS